LQRRHFPDAPVPALMDSVVHDLEAAGALRFEGAALVNAG